MDCIICRYGELALKGKNRNLFENRLVNNIRICLEKNSIDADVEKIRGRIFVFTKDESAADALKNVFGLVSLSHAIIAESDIEDIKTKTIAYAKQALDAAQTNNQAIKTFRITTNRVDKKFTKSSHEMDIILGDIVGDTYQLKARMKHPDLNIGVEIHKKTFIFHEKIDCFGGLPLGISGNVVCMIENEQDIAAAWLMMRRGCDIFPVSFSEMDISTLNRFSYGIDLKLSRITDISGISGFAADKRCQAVVSGADLDGFDPDRFRETGMTVLTPLIGYDKSQINSLLEKIR
ncbi:THUMP domain-containing protein [Nanoarchaeota archaeon]